MSDTEGTSQPQQSRGRRRTVPYNALTRPVTCEWVFPDSGMICGESFTDMDQFTDHVRQSHIQNPYTPGGALDTPTDEILSGVCCWNSCNFTSLTLTSPEFVNHVLFHPYHSYLKLVGEEVIRARKLANCRMDSSLCNLIPPLDVQLQCHWEGGGCGVVFDSAGEFYRHVHDHVITSKQLVCLWGECTFKSQRNTKVNDHIRSHLKEKMVACPTCGALFSNNTKLSDHVVRQQTDTMCHSCSFCHKVFSSDRLLRDHTRRHVNTLQCPQCELTCHGPSQLLRHIRYRHMTVKLHECALCHKTFKTSHDLSEHIETHREPSYVCTFPNCDFKASSTRALDRHTTSLHVSDCMLYCCHVCSERFTVGKKLTQHLKVAHGFQLPPGHCRFRYLAGVDGLKRLQTIRLDDEHLITPELNTYSTPSTSTLSDSTIHPQ